MPLYEVTYPSGPWRVKGYLAWPDDYALPRDVRDVWRESVVRAAGIEAAAAGCVGDVRADVERVPGSLQTWAGEYWIPPSCRPPSDAASDVHPACDVPQSRRSASTMSASITPDAPEGSQAPDVDAIERRGERHRPDGLPGGLCLPPARAWLRCVSFPVGGAHGGAGGATLPAVVFCRGGIGRVGAVRKHWLAHWATSQRCVLFAPCYRGNEGSEGRDEFGGADVDDVRVAVRIVRALPFVQPDAVYLVGFSRGAINALAAVADPDPRTATDVYDERGVSTGAADLGTGEPPRVTPPRAAAVAVWGGVADLAAIYEERVDLRRMLRRVIGGTPRRVPERYAARSAVRWADRIRIPVVVVHGTNDRQVGVHHARWLADALARAGSPPVAVHLYQGAGHHLPPLLHDAVVTRLMDALKTAAITHKGQAQQNLRGRG